MEMFLKLFKENQKTVIGLFTGLALISVIKRYFNGPVAKPKSLSGKVVIITGASDGIGVPTAKSLLENDATVIFACRNPKKTKIVIDKFEERLKQNAFFIQIDLSDFSTIKNFVETFKKKFSKVDILINNAGAIFNDYSLSKDEIENTFQVNTFSPMLLTQELLPLMSDNSRIINVSSRAHTRVRFDKTVMKLWEEQENTNYFKNIYKPWTVYGYSKLGNIFFTKYLYDYCFKKGINIRTACLHPGVIPTELARDLKYLSLFAYLIFPIFWLLTKSSYYGSQTTLHLCYCPDNEFINAGYYQDCKIGLISEKSGGNDKESTESFINWSRKVINSKSNKVGLEFNI